MQTQLKVNNCGRLIVSYFWSTETLSQHHISWFSFYDDLHHLIFKWLESHFIIHIWLFGKFLKDYCMFIWHVQIKLLILHKVWKWLTHTHTYIFLNKGRGSNIKFLKHCYSNGTTHNLDYNMLVLHRYID